MAQEAETTRPRSFGAATATSTFRRCGEFGDDALEVDDASPATCNGEGREGRAVVVEESILTSLAPLVMATWDDKRDEFIPILSPSFGNWEPPPPPPPPTSTVALTRRSTSPEAALGRESIVVVVLSGASEEGETSTTPTTRETAAHRDSSSSSSSSSSTLSPTTPPASSARSSEFSLSSRARCCAGERSCQ